MEKWLGYEEEKQMKDIIEYKFQRCKESLSEDLEALQETAQELIQMLNEAMEPQSDYNLSQISCALCDVIESIYNAEKAVEKGEEEISEYYTE